MNKCPECGAEVERHQSRDSHPAGIDICKCKTVIDTASGKVVAVSWICLRNQIAQLQAVVDKLPKDSDGVPVTDWHAAMWIRREDKNWLDAPVLESNWAVWRLDYMGHDDRVSIHSTREAAKEAHNAKQ